MDMKVIVFQLHNEEYGIPVQQVRGIEKMQHITRVPRTTSYIKGVINLRGVVTPIIDLRARFDLDEIPYTDHTRIIIAAVGEIEVGLIVESANDVIDIDSSTIEPAPEIVDGIEVDYLNGVVKVDQRLLILLNLHKILEIDAAEVEG